MKFYSRYTIVFISFTLSACQFLETFEKPEGVAVQVANSHSEEFAKYNKNLPKTSVIKPKVTESKTTTQRINTTACQDPDDWYLDGYRVGKSFAHQKAQMLQQRLNYCHYNGTNIPSHFKTNWQRGFNIGKMR